jgi:hypothetical protein
MKRGVSVVFVLVLMFSLFSFSLVSAGWFGDMWGKITGNVVSGPTEGLVAYYDFENDFQDTLGTVAQDSVVVGDVTFVDGKFGNAAGFDGSGDRIAIPNLINNQDQFTISAWFNYEDSNTWRWVFGGGGTWNNNPGVAVRSGSNILRYHMRTESASKYNLDGSVIVDANQWNHVVYIYDGSSLVSYVNGQKDVDYAISGKVVAPLTQAIGAGFWNNNEYFNGAIDEVRIYDKALSEGEVLGLYVGESPGDCIDSDGGLDYYVNGSANNNTDNYVDLCNPLGKLAEAVCSNGKPGYNSPFYDCPNGCSDGACIELPTVNGTINTTAICTDSDGGLDFYEKGSVLFNYLGSRPIVEFNDQCLDFSNPDTGYPVSSCSGTGCTLDERGCNAENNMISNEFSCPNGCSDGACIELPTVNGTTNVTVSCVDSDGGLNYYVKGIVENSVNNSAMDICVSPTADYNLFEFKCESEGRVSGSYPYNCPNGCEDGACVPSEDQCVGCSDGDRCIPYGIRIEGDYCDIDGQLKRQKNNAPGEEWTSCQNNYECESNICSYGECVDIRGIADQAKGIGAFFIKLGCKLGNLFNNENYNQCLWDNLGDGEGPEERTLITVEVVRGDGSLPEWGESYALEKLSNRLNLNETIRSIIPSVDEDEFPNVLSDGVFTDSWNNEFDYRQDIYFGEGLRLERFQDNDYGPNEEIGFHISSLENILNYTLDFVDMPELDKMQGQMINILGRKMQVQHISSNSNEVGLIDLPFSFLVSENDNMELVVYDAPGIKSNYEIEIIYISSTEIRLSINGETTSPLNDGDVFTLNDGRFIVIKDILYSAKETGVSKVELLYGFGALEFISGREVNYDYGNSEGTVGGFIGYLETETDPYTGAKVLNSLSLVWNAGDEFFLTPTTDLVLPVPESSLSFSMSELQNNSEEIYATVYLSGDFYNFISSSAGGSSGGGSGGSSA